MDQRELHAYRWMGGRFLGAETWRRVWALGLRVILYRSREERGGWFGVTGVAVEPADGWSLIG